MCRREKSQSLSDKYYKTNDFKLSFVDVAALSRSASVELPFKKLHIIRQQKKRLWLTVVLEITSKFNLSKFWCDELATHLISFMHDLMRRLEVTNSTVPKSMSVVSE